MHVPSTLRSAIALSGLFALIITGCGASVDSAQTATIRGSLSEDESSAGGTSFDGAGTLAAAQTIRASAFGPGGQLSVASETTLDANGRYSLTVPADSGRMLVQAIDAKGEVLASTVVDVAQQSEGAVTASPITTQTSVAATVFVEMAAEGMSAAQVDLASLRERIDAKVAEVVQETAATGHDTSAEVKALAQAQIAAQKAELKTYAKAGSSITADALAQAKVEAMQQYEATLDASAKTEAEEREAFDAAVDAALKAKAQIDEELHARAEQAASVAFRSTLKAKLSASASNEVLIDAATRAEAAIEARLVSLAVNATLRSAATGQAALDSAIDAGAELTANVKSAVNAEAAAQAFASYETSITGSSQSAVSASVLGQMIDADASSSAQVEAALHEMLDASAQAEAQLDAAIDAAIQTAAMIDLEAAASGVVTAYDAFDSSVKHAVQTHLSGLTPKASASAELIVLVEGSFQHASN